jgi:Tfp pilus assembly protein FimT
MGDKGISLAEVLTVICIVSVLSIMSIPPYLAYRNKSVIIGCANELAADMQLARNKALNSGDYVAILFRDNGYYIFVDNGDEGGKAGDYIINGGEQVLLSKEISPLLAMNTTFSARRYRFKTFGRIKPGSVTLDNGTGGRVKVIVSAIGRIRTEVKFES